MASSPTLPATGLTQRQPEPGCSLQACLKNRTALITTLVIASLGIVAMVVLAVPAVHIIRPWEISLGVSLVLVVIIIKSAICLRRIPAAPAAGSSVRAPNSSAQELTLPAVAAGDSSVSLLSQPPVSSSSVAVSSASASASSVSDSDFSAEEEELLKFGEAAQIMLFDQMRSFQRQEQTYSQAVSRGKRDKITQRLVSPMEKLGKAVASGLRFSGLSDIHSVDKVEKSIEVWLKSRLFLTGDTIKAVANIVVQHSSLKESDPDKFFEMIGQGFSQLEFKHFGILFNCLLNKKDHISFDVVAFINSLESATRYYITLLPPS